MQATETTSSTVRFQRRIDIPGIEVRTLDPAGPSWHSYSTGYEFVISGGWEGPVWHRGGIAEFGPGALLCARPGDLFSSRGMRTEGRCCVLSIDAALLGGYLARLQLSPARFPLAGLVAMSSRLRTSLAEVLWSVRPSPSRVVLDVALSSFVQALAYEALERQDPSLRPSPDDAERVRRCLFEETGAKVDLATIAQKTGLSRFQALRAFKRSYGLPPHAYQLRMRLALARRLLRQGVSPARVAAEFGFVDQSHLTRHFKRLLGVTPARYARFAMAPSPVF